MPCVRRHVVPLEQLQLYFIITCCTRSTRLVVRGRALGPTPAAASTSAPPATRDAKAAATASSASNRSRLAWKSWAKVGRRHNCLALRQCHSLGRLGVLDFLMYPRHVLGRPVRRLLCLPIHQTGCSTRIETPCCNGFSRYAASEGD